MATTADVIGANNIPASRRWFEPSRRHQKTGLDEPKSERFELDKGLNKPLAYGHFYGQSLTRARTGFGKSR
jgi:hypothetical protein